VDKLSILILEDVEGDAKLMARALATEGIEFSTRRVETREDFLRALKEAYPDVILADYRLPYFDGRSALKLARERLPLVPVIIVTGALVDDDAVELLREGAADYILKDRLSRLAPAVRRALDDARMKALRQENEEKYRALFELSRDGIALFDFDTGHVADCNPEFESQAGYPLARLRQHPIWELQRAGKVEAARAMFEQVRNAGAVGDEQFELHRPDGTVLPIEFRARVIELGGRRFVQAQVHDITRRLDTEAKLRAQIAELRRFQKVTVDRELRMQELETRLACVAAHIKAA
jgi:PAS domain S-box-containing protein